MLAQLRSHHPAAPGPRAADIALAAVVVVVGQAFAWAAPTIDGPKAVTVPVALVVGVALAWRRHAPLTVLLVTLGAVVAQEAVVRRSPSIVFLAILLIIVSSAAAHLPPRRGLLAGAIALISVEAVDLLDRTASRSDKVFTAVVLVGLPWLAGRLLHDQRARSRELVVQNDHLRVERDERARAAVAAERVRIARDLHDVIAHSVSVMIVQAGAAEQILGVDPARAREPLEAIRATGKAALNDMRRLLGVLRTDEEGLDLAPQPTLRDLEALAERFSAAGLPVRLAIRGEQAVLPPGIEMTAYRVCQEALTNALRHGGGQATLTVELGPQAVEIAVSDDGAGRPAEHVATGGHGLVGMRERVALYGGELQAGLRPGGGFAVRARLPREHAPA